MRWSVDCKVDALAGSKWLQCFGIDFERGDITLTHGILLSSVHKQTERTNNIVSVSPAIPSDSASKSAARRQGLGSSTFRVDILQWEDFTAEHRPRCTSKGSHTGVHILLTCFSTSSHTALAPPPVTATLTFA